VVVRLVDRDIDDEGDAGGVGLFGASEGRAEVVG
jgi:hypothetical protein